MLENQKGKDEDLKKMSESLTSEGNMRRKKNQRFRELLNWGEEKDYNYVC